MSLNLLPSLPQFAYRRTLQRYRIAPLQSYTVIQPELYVEILPLPFWSSTNLNFHSTVASLLTLLIANQDNVPRDRLVLAPAQIRQRLTSMVCLPTFLYPYPISTG